MSKLFAPALGLSNRLRYRQKFLLVGALMGLPVLTCAYILWSDMQLHAGVRALVIVSIVCSLLVLYLFIGLYLSTTRTIALFDAAIVRFSKGDLSARVQANTVDELGQVAKTFNAMGKEIKRMIASVSSHASEVADGAAKLSAQCKRISDGSLHQSEAATSTAAAIQEITASFEQVAGHARDTESVSNKATELSAGGEQIVRAASMEMSRIAESFKTSSEELFSLGKRTEEINSIVKVIKEIADQTNLLALNAAIEAARAGEEGRGFAVVAEEVRHLAERTSNATTEIAGIVESIKKSTNSAVSSMESSTGQVLQGVQLASKAGDALANINSGARDALGMVHDIALAVKEQSTASSQIADNVEQISAMVQQNTAGLEQMSRDAAALDKVAANLKNAISLFSGGTANEATKLVEKAVQHLSQNGRQKAFAAFNDPHGAFVLRDLYIFVYSMSGQVLAHGGNPAMLGKQMLDAKDAKGKAFVRERIEIASTKGKGWQDYLFLNPETKEVESKTSYIEKVDDLIVGCGIYK
ncbi:MAG TPA: methyl-accepting chemotaxis protein [Burkholderiales bacterium]|nr:methyl-accepting chemotaxis protein [Burkholderiales bacterium]